MLFNLSILLLSPLTYKLTVRNASTERAVGIHQPSSSIQQRCMCLHTPEFRQDLIEKEIQCPEIKM